MSQTLRIEKVQSASMSSADFDALIALCSEAYEEPFAQYFANIGPGMHLLGKVDGELVSHVMWVPRELHVADVGTLQTAYVEAVATLQAEQGRGYASALMRAVPAHLDVFDFAALSPSDHAWYARFGWETWRGPLSYWQQGVETPTPEEELMVLRLPRTPAALDIRAAIACDWRPGEVW
jgi:aminoglycoside 2'-N-acetyltransferase I